MHDATTFPGVLLTCHLVGVLEMNDVRKEKKERNDRFFAVPVGSHTQQRVRDIDDVSDRLRTELEAFFSATNALKQKEIEVVAWRGRDVALRSLEEARAFFAKKE
jgi:inorganic pyrophosphatase